MCRIGSQKLVWHSALCAAAGHALGFWLNRGLAAAWNKWREFMEQAIAAKASMGASLAHWIQRDMARAWRTWREVGTRRHRGPGAVSCVQRMGSL